MRTLDVLWVRKSTHVYLSFTNVSYVIKVERHSQLHLAPEDTKLSLVLILKEMGTNWASQRNMGFGWLISRSRRLRTSIKSISVCFISFITSHKYFYNYEYRFC